MSTSTKPEQKTFIVLLIPEDPSLPLQELVMPQHWSYKDLIVPYIGTNNFYSETLSGNSKGPSIQYNPSSYYIAKEYEESFEKPSINELKIPKINSRVVQLFRKESNKKRPPYGSVIVSHMETMSIDDDLVDEFYDFGIKQYNQYSQINVHKYLSSIKFLKEKFFEADSPKTFKGASWKCGWTPKGIISEFCSKSNFTIPIYHKLSKNAPFTSILSFSLYCPLPDSSSFKNPQNFPHKLEDINKMIIDQHSRSSSSSISIEEIYSQHPSVLRESNTIFSSSVLINSSDSSLGVEFSNLRDAEHNAALNLILKLIYSSDSQNKELLSHHVVSEEDDEEEIKEEKDESKYNSQLNSTTIPHPTTTNENQTENQTQNHDTQCGDDNGDSSSCSMTRFIKTNEREEWEDISEDGGILKKIVSKGSGSIFVNGDVVSVHYQSYLLSFISSPTSSSSSSKLSSSTSYQINEEFFHEKEIDDSISREEPLVYIIGEEENILGCLQMGIKSMRNGETSVFLVHYNYSYGPLGCPPLIPPESLIKFQISVIGVNRMSGDDDELSENQQKNKNYNKNKEESLSERTKRLYNISLLSKEEGNGFYSKEAYRRALTSYNKAIKMCEEIMRKNWWDNSKPNKQIETPNDISQKEGQGSKREKEENEIDMEKQVKKVLVQLYLNSAQCRLKLSGNANVYRSVQLCTQALEIDQHFPKGWFRRSQSYLLVNDFEQSLKDLEKWKEKSLQTNEFEKALFDSQYKRIKRAEQSHQESLKKKYSNMFS